MRPTELKCLRPKTDNIWPCKWIHPIRYPSKDLEVTMQKLLIYYPKDPRALVPITSEIKSALTYPRRKLLYSRIVSRYKHDLMTYQNVDITHRPFLAWPTCRSARSIRFWEQMNIGQEDDDLYEDCIYAAKKSIRANKRLERLEVDMGTINDAEIFKDLRFVPSLRSLHISLFLNWALEGFKKAIYSSRLTLETVILTGTLLLKDPAQLFKSILELPRLKKLKIDGHIKSNFDIDQIPFSLLNKKDISYDIRLPHQSESFQFSLPNEISLEKLDFLGLNFNKNWLTWYNAQDYSFEEHVKMQQNFQRSLFINLDGKPRTDISKLFSSCRNIKALDIILSNTQTCNRNGFKNLKDLVNLQHIFIQLIQIPHDVMQVIRQLPDSTQALFENLKACAQTLESVNLHIYGEADFGKSIRAITDFFEACSDTLKHITLKFSFYQYCVGKNLKLFYTALSKLKGLTNATVIYEGYSADEFGEHSGELKNLLSNNKALQELKVSAESLSPNLVNLDFSRLKNLQSLSLEYSTLTPDSEFLVSFSTFANSLRNLELNLDSLDEQMWYKLLNKLDSLQVLESLKLRISILEVSEREATNELRSWMKKKPLLKFLVYGQGGNPLVVNVFLKDGLLYVKEEVDDFFRRGPVGCIEKRYHKLYKV